MNPLARISTPHAQPRPASPDNPRLAALYADDQADRAGPTNDIDLERMRARGIPRRAEVAAMIERGDLHTANDYYHAAMLYQHGRTLDYVRKAYELARTGAALDPTHNDVRWLTAAAFDRICMYENRPQRYGTQFTKDKDSDPWTLYRFDPTTTDAERAKWGVPSLAKQLERAAKMNRGEA